MDAKGDYRAAAAEFRQAIKLQGDFAPFYYNLAMVLQEQGELDQAIVAYRTASLLQPNFANAHLGLGEISELQGKRDEAIREYRTASERQPKLADAHTRIAWALVKKPDCSAQERSEALEHARKAVELNREDGGFHTTLALAEYRAGHWAESIAAAERSTELMKGVDAPIGANWFFVAMARWQQGGRDEARKWFDKAVAWTKEKYPDNAELRQFWAEAAELLGQPGPSTTSSTAPAETGPGKPR